MFRFLITVVLVLVLCPICSFASGGDTWNSAAEAYRSGDYRAALELFETLENTKPSDELYYNIGNCHYHLDEIPRSILYYEKALKFNPRNALAQDNLELARSKMDEPVIGIEPFFLVKWVRGAALSVSPLVWGIVGLVILWLIALGYAHTIRTKRVLRLRERIIPLMVLLIVLGLGYISYNHTVRTDYGIVMENTSLKEAPDEISPTSRQLEGGEKVHVLDALDGYYKVRLINYEVGWVPETVVRSI